jgi:hypothetical protein
MEAKSLLRLLAHKNLQAAKGMGEINIFTV